LCVDITALGDGTACRVSLGDEDAGIFFQPFSFRVVEVDTAVTQFAVMQEKQEDRVSRKRKKKTWENLFDD